jgi:hypothetical protein
MKSHALVIPSAVEGSRNVTLKISQRDPSVRAGRAFLFWMTGNGN